MNVLETDSRRKTRAERLQIEFGDFQTPPDLASAACRFLSREQPSTLVEPTCGRGTFLAAALACFPRARHVFGMDVNPRHTAVARRRLAGLVDGGTCQVVTADFFRFDWQDRFSRLPEPILVIGNPPWVTNATLGRFGSANHPRKENRWGLSGLDALTGKSNFDVSEWMILRLLEALRGRRATLAMLCKTAVAQKLLARLWNVNFPIERCEIRSIDAGRHFGAQVDAGLFFCRLGRGRPSQVCGLFRDFESRRPDRMFGLRDGHLVADLARYQRVRHLVGGSCRWRSGVKHDCSAVFELWAAGSKYRNGLGETVDLESEFVFPLLKSSHLAAGKAADPPRAILLPQRSMQDQTHVLKRSAPRVWRYLQRHAARLDRRASSIYRDRPRFSVFGVGPYTFSKWKVAVSGFYATRRFVAVGPVKSRPVVCDDTCYVLPCRSAAEAHLRADLLNGERGQEFFSAFVFGDGKRPLTARVLNLLDLDALAAESRGAGRRRLR